MKTPSKLTRNCLVCGEEKPLAAFLQITGTQGTIYGNVCSTCRSKTSRTKATAILDDEDVSRGSSGQKIDSKARVYNERKQKEEIKQAREIHDTGIEERDVFVTEKEDKKVEKQSGELRHRRDYIERKELEEKTPFKDETTLTQERDTLRVTTQNKERKRLDQGRTEQVSSEEQQFVERYEGDKGVERGQQHNVDNRQKQKFLDYQSVKNQSVIDYSKMQSFRETEGLAFEHRFTGDLQHTEKNFCDVMTSLMDIRSLFLDPNSSQVKLRSEIFRRYREWFGKEPNTAIVDRLIKNIRLQLEALIKKGMLQKTTESFGDFEKKHWRPGSKK